MDVLFSLRMRRSILSFTCVLLASIVLKAQDNELPYYIGTESSFENYFHKSFVALQKTTDDVCDTSVGFVEFQLDKRGHVTSVLIPPNFPDKVAAIIDTIMRGSEWAPASTLQRKDSKTIPMILPLYISIEAGCKAGDVRRKFGLEKDFRMMFPGLEEKKLKSCYVLKPITYVVPAGFQD
jgi:hypothetical protein